MSVVTPAQVRSHAAAIRHLHRLLDNDGIDAGGISPFCVFCVAKRDNQEDHAADCPVLHKSSIRNFTGVL